MVDEHVTFEMVEFMLHDAGEESFNPFVVGLEFFIEVAHMDAGRTSHSFVDSREAKATFFHGFGFCVVEFKDMGIDVGFLETFVFGIVFLEVVEGDDYYADGFADLRSCKAYTVTVDHRFEHVGNELFEVRIVGGDVLSLFAQDRHTIGVNGEKHYSEVVCVVSVFLNRSNWLESYG